MTELEQQMYQRGIEASVLLEQPLFTETVSELSKGILDAIASTAPSDSSKRETLYYMHRGLQDVMTTLISIQQYKEQLEQREQSLEDLSTDDMLFDD